MRLASYAGPDAPRQPALTGPLPARMRPTQSNTSAPPRPEDPVYLTGSYEGAPFGLAVVVHPEAGLFNLEENGHPVVVRAKIEVNPYTGREPDGEAHLQRWPAGRRCRSAVNNADR